MEPTQLTDRAVLALDGPGGRAFLQGLVTNDLDQLSPKTALYAALLGPQGKILFDFLLAETAGGTILIDCPAPARAGLARKLELYRLRAQVEIAPRDDLAVFAALSDSPPATFADPRHPSLPRRTIRATSSIPAPPAGPAEYHRLRFDLGIPEGADFGEGQVFALDGGLEELHAVSFTKGCYVGQELTSRMKHRGSDRKRILPVRAKEALPPPGTSVEADGQQIGQILAVDGTRGDSTSGFALVRLDRLKDDDTSLTAGATPVTLQMPAWLGLRHGK